MKNTNKILETLSISASNTREDTLKSIAITTLSKASAAMTYSEFLQQIESDFGLQLYELEVKKTLSMLIEEGKLLFKDEKYQLDESERANLRTMEYRLRSNDTTRFSNFRDFIATNFGHLSIDEIKHIWQLFREYIYECFYYYGVKANQMMSPKYQFDTEAIVTNTDILYSLTADVQKEETREVLKYAVDNFHSYAASEDIDFLDELGQKTLAFTSLGLDPTLASESFDSRLIDWILFLDTNFLFSILDLHNNVEDDACKELIKLVKQNENYVKIDFKFTELTLKELRNKKEEFNVIDSSLSKSGIRALLKSEDLDEFSRKYYANLLEDPDSAMHPSEVIDLAQTTLPGLNITLYRTKPMTDNLGQEFLNAKIQEYQRFIDRQNQIREDFSKPKGGRIFKELYRNDHQLEHDVTLREVVLMRRGSPKKKETKTMNDAKYFAATLDELLLKFDTYDRRLHGDAEYPVFFKPSFLLNKLVRILPVKTEDYKKAFLKAVSARGFNKDVRKSRDIIKIVSYLKTRGIDNEDVILNLINEQVFLDKYRSDSPREDFSMDEFVESELNSMFAKTSIELDKTKRELNERNAEKINDLEDNKRLNQKISTLSEQLSLYQSEVTKYHTRLKAIEASEKKQSKVSNYQTALDFNAQQQENKIKELELKVQGYENEMEKAGVKALQERQNEYIRKQKIKWRRPSIVFAATVLLFTVLAGAYVLYSNEWSVRDAVDQCKNNEITSILIAIILAISNFVFLKLVYDKIFNHSNIKAFEDRTRNNFPDSLK